MRRFAKILLVLVGVLVLALIGGYWYARPLLLTGTGYAAHNACAVTWVAERTDAQRDLPPNALVPHLATRFDDSGGSATSTVRGLLAAQTAWFTPGYGCTVATERPSLRDASAIAAPNALLAAPARPDRTLDAAVARAFGDHLAPAQKKGLGTRGIVVVRDGVVVAERYAPGFTDRTPQLGWSMAKSVTNLVVGRLVQQGKVSVDDAGLRPEWTDGRREITIDNLMRMTSGLAWDEAYQLGSPITRMLYTEPDMASFVASQPSAHPVGAVQQYSSGSTTLLCSVLAVRAGAGADLMRREIFEPLGLTSAVMEPDAAGTPVCSSYLWATPREWAAIGQFAVDDGVHDGRRLLPQGWLAASTRVESVANVEDPNYAAGWWANKRPDGTLIHPPLPADAYWAQGHDGQFMYVVPSQRLVVVRLGFSPGAADSQLGLVELVAHALR